MGHDCIFTNLTTLAGKDLYCDRSDSLQKSRQNQTSII